VGSCRLASSGSEYGSVASSCEHCNEISGSAKYGELVD